MTLLVVAPWLSQRTQEVLAGEGVSYIDLTGNARVRLDSPPLYIETAGALHSPVPLARGQLRLRGPKSARLIRMLADVQPPFGVHELAKEIGVSQGYASQLLETLDREALIERSPQGAVYAVDAPALLRRWAVSYSLFQANEAKRFVAPAGIGATLAALAESRAAQAVVALSGALAAARLVAVEKPASLLAYCERPAALGKVLRLAPAPKRANVVLLKPFDPVVWERTATVGGLRYAAPSQVVVDCLTAKGPTREAGAALLEWMQANEEEWRLPPLWRSGRGWGS